MSVKWIQLAEQFKKLIEERDHLIWFREYNSRCAEIDDIEIPAIIRQVPPGKKSEFNELVNSILGEN
jgi:hypothetical protein